MKSPKLAPFKSLADGLGVCTRTIERMYDRGDAGLPEVVWILRRRFVVEAERDAFIATVIYKGRLPVAKPPPAGAAAVAAEERRAAQRTSGATETEAA